jgi:hypothetical protein
VNFHVAVDVSGEIKKVMSGFDMSRFDSTLKQDSIAFIFIVEIPSVAYSYSSHEFTNSAITNLFQNKMKMIGKKREADNFNQWFLFPKIVS